MLITKKYLKKNVIDGNELTILLCTLTLQSLLINLVTSKYEKYYSDFDTFRRFFKRLGDFSKKNKNFSNVYYDHQIDHLQKNQWIIKNNGL